MYHASPFGWWLMPSFICKVTGAITPYIIKSMMTLPLRLFPVVEQNTKHKIQNPIFQFCVLSRPDKTGFSRHNSSRILNFVIRTVFCHAVTKYKIEKSGFVFCLTTTGEPWQNTKYKSRKCSVLCSVFCILSDHWERPKGFNIHILIFIPTKHRILGDVPPYPPKLKTGLAMIFSFVLEVTGNRATLFECKILEVTGNQATGSQPCFFRLFYHW